MATGDTSDIVSRLKRALPTSWFSSDSLPVLGIVLSGFALPLSWVYQLYSYTIQQMRIRTATGVWIDRISYDFLGNKLPRKFSGNALTGQITSSESDDGYRARVIDEIMRPRQTRVAISKALSDLTGWEPVIIELFSPHDCGGYDIGVFAYDCSGCYGDLVSNNQILVTAFRPYGDGIANVNGLDGGFAGYDVGGGEYIDMDWVAGAVTDADIYNVVARTIAAGQAAWTAIENKPPLITDLDGSLLTDGNGMLLTVL